MSGQSLTRYRIAVLEDMGEEKIAEAYLEHRTMRKMFAALFEPRAPGETPTYAFFYEWLKQGGEDRAHWWSEVKALRGALDADESVDIVMDADAKTSHVAALQAKTLQWRAERTNRRYSSKVSVDTKVTVDLGQNLLEAIKANELNKQQTLAAIAEATDGDDTPFWETVE